MQQSAPQTSATVSIPLNKITNKKKLFTNLSSPIT